MTAERRLLCPVVIGRDEEAGRVDEAVREAFLGRGGVVAVTGPAGVGKSVLVKQAAARARQLGATVLSGRAVPSEIPQAYRP